MVSRKTRLLIMAIYLLVMAVCFFVVAQTGLAQEKMLLTAIGWGMAGLLILAMGVYAASVVIANRKGRAVYSDASLPEVVSPDAPQSPFPPQLADIDHFLTGMRFARTAEFKGSRDSSGAPIPSWSYSSELMSFRATVALDAPLNTPILVLSTYFGDETMLVTRLSLARLAVRRPGYQLQTARSLGEIVGKHNDAVSRLSFAHGKPFAAITSEQMREYNEKYFRRNLGYMFDAATRRNTTWMLVVNGIGLIAVADALYLLNQPTFPPQTVAFVLATIAFLLSMIAGISLYQIRPLLRRS